jgi:hypothetical protein
VALIIGILSKKDGYLGALLRLALDSDFPLMSLDYFLRDGQTQTAALGFERKEGLEYFFLDLRGDSRTGITDLQEYAVSPAAALLYPVRQRAGVYRF